MSNTQTTQTTGRVIMSTDTDPKHTDANGAPIPLINNYQSVWNFVADPKIAKQTRDDVHSAVSQAVAYVWGWMDAGGTMPTISRGADLSAAFEFGWYFGALKMSGRSHPSIAEAWRAWSALG